MKGLHTQFESVTKPGFDDPQCLCERHMVLMAMISFTTVLICIVILIFYIPKFIEKN